MTAPRFHPLVQRWFASRLGQPTAPQVQGWRHIASGKDTLIAAPTGSGKTLAAFLWALNRLVERGAERTLEDHTSIIYVSPLKALGNDIQKNLRRPLDEIAELAFAAGTPLPEIRVMVRSGDTPAAERQSMVKRPPHILITTPESLYILLTAERSRKMLAKAETVIIDEIHAIAGDKRAAHLALSLERLDALAKRRLQRIGLSATQKPIEEVARLLVGTDRLILGNTPDCAIVDVGHKRDIELGIEVMDHDLGPIASHEMYADIYDRIVALGAAHRTTIVFVNTRRLVERVAHQLGQRLGEDKVAAHHGSMSRETRLRAEDGLKNGTIPVVVATASLELGIDVGHVDLVCHIGAPRAIATLLQRVGRSGHWLGATPKGILFPVTRDDLVQCAALVRAVQRGELDRIFLIDKPLDILAQQLVATIAAEEMGEDDLRRLVRRAYPYRGLTEQELDDVLEMVAEGVASRRGRRSAHLHRDRVNRRLRARRGARLAAITGGGAIPDTADFDVIEEPGEIFIGKVNEDFAIESVAGDVFLLGNRAWRIRRVEAGKVRVVDAEGAAPTIPFWIGEAPARTIELSAAVAELRHEVEQRIGDRAAVVEWVRDECALDELSAQQLVTYLAESLAMLGALPTQATVVAERFFDESGGMQLVVHAPFGGRINRAWGLALRKRFCRTFDFELQAAATDDGLILSLGEQHSFPLANIFELVRADNVEEALVQAALISPLFANRWRWNATRALALLRFSGGRKVPLQIQRMRAEDLLAAVFPAQVACQDNHGGGPIEPPDHPLVNETIANCLHEAMDLEGLKDVLARIESGAIRTVAVDTPAPSPLSHEILNANPYAFLDDAPLEERRARAVSLRRVDPELAGGIGALDPEAIAEVRAQAWPDVRDADELHDLLLNVGILPTAVLAELLGSEDAAVHPLVAALVADRRATFARWGENEALVATERVEHVKAALAPVAFAPTPPALAGAKSIDAEDAVRSMIHGWMECLGPITAADLAALLGLAETTVEAALYRLEMDGIVLQGSFLPPRTPNPEPGTRPEAKPDWCERRLLARIHRLTVGRLRKEIEAVSPADFLRFLLRWQHVDAEGRMTGREGVLRIVEQLQGLELPAPAWEAHVLPARLRHYDEGELEHVCLSGEIAWGRLRWQASAAGDDEADEPSRRRRVAPNRAAPLAFCRREDLPRLLEPAPDEASLVADLSDAALQVYEFLRTNGASFLVDVARAIDRLPGQTEDALWELVARGLVTGDGIAGLRGLLRPAPKSMPGRGLRGIAGGASRRLIPVGRWAVLRPAAVRSEGSDRVEWYAKLLLKRWGVVLRELLVRETRAPRWRELLPVLRRMEARGEIRGGRFVSGFVGEQFALPEAVDTLRAVRRKPGDGETVIVAAADPLNLVGILVPGQRISPFVQQFIAYENGVAVAVGTMAEITSSMARAGTGA
jgi:ATP-dependent Lhr-like helicase